MSTTKASEFARNARGMYLAPLLGASAGVGALVWEHGVSAHLLIGVFCGAIIGGCLVGLGHLKYTALMYATTKEALSTADEALERERRLLHTKHAHLYSGGSH